MKKTEPKRILITLRCGNCERDLEFDRVVVMPGVYTRCWDCYNAFFTEEVETSSDEDEV